MKESNQMTAPQPVPDLPDTFAEVLAAFAVDHGLTFAQLAQIEMPPSLLDALRARIDELMAKAVPSPASPASPAAMWERGWRAALAADPDFDPEAERIRIALLAASTPRAFPAPVLVAAWDDGLAHGKRGAAR